MKELTTEIDIHAPPERVWQILTDFDHYPDWNPFIYRVEGKAELGGRAKIYIRVGTRELTLMCTILKFDPCRELRWTWRIVSPALYGGEHSFTMTGADEVRFVDREVFSGLLVPLFSKSIDRDSKPGFEAMDRALKARAEQA